MAPTALPLDIAWIGVGTIGAIRHVVVQEELAPLRLERERLSGRLEKAVAAGNVLPTRSAPCNGN